MNAGRIWDEGPGAEAPLSRAAGAGGSRRLRWVALGLCVVVALVVRFAALLLAPRYAFLSDHVDYMVWSEYAYEHGPTRIYDLPAPTLVNLNAPPWWLAERFRVPPSLAGRFTVTPCPSYSRCNYPPLAAYAFWLQGLMWTALDDEVVTHQVAPHIAAEVDYDGGTASSRVANTLTARFVNGVIAAVTDFLLACGLALLVRALRGEHGLSGVAVWAFGLAVLAPPLFLDSAFWSQTDSWLACCLVWCVYLLVVGRYALAGVAYGLALLTKAQAIVFAPVIAYVFLALIFMPGGSLRRVGRLWRMAVGTALTVALLAAPFSLASAGHPEHGWLRWAYRAYVVPVRTDFPFATLKAFNIWWLDFAWRGQTREALDADATALGLGKDLVGKGAVAVAVLVAGAACARHWRWSRVSWPAFAFLVLLAAFLLPTRVHERYIYYCLPFLIAIALLWCRWLPVLVALLVVGSFEMTWYLWYAPPDSAPWATARSPNVQAWSVFLAFVALASFVYALATLLPRAPHPSNA